MDQKELMSWQQREWEMRRLRRRIEIVMEEIEWAKNRFKQPPANQ